METENRTVLFQLLSTLLQYPDDTFLSTLADIEKGAGKLSSEEWKTAVAAFLLYLKTYPPLRLQEDFTAAFDMNPSTTLNMTWHAYGDNEKRAEALARLQRIYDAAGWERMTGDLPDYLPLMLEFLSVCPEPEDLGKIWESFNGIHPLIERLESTAPAYAVLLKPLAGMAARMKSKKGNSSAVS